MATDKGKAAKKQVVKAHAGKPLSPTEDPTDHSVSAGELAKTSDPLGKSGATVNAKSIDAAADNEDEKDAAAKAAAEDDKTLAGKIRKSELFFVNDHPSGGGPYVGISPQNDPNASEPSKRLSSVMPLTVVAPKTGLRVVKKDGTSFVVGDGFGPDAVPGDWGRVVDHDGNPLFA